MDYKTKYLKLNYNGCAKISEDNLQNPIFIIDRTDNTDNTVNTDNTCNILV